MSDSHGSHNQRAYGLIQKHALLPAKKLLFELRHKAVDPEDVARYNTAILYLGQNKPDDAMRILQDPTKMGSQLLLNRASGSAGDAGVMSSIPNDLLAVIACHVQALENPKPKGAKKLVF
jgi:hypothetical protein